MLDPIQSDGSSLQSSIPDENGNSAEYCAPASDFADNEGKISSIPRAVRKAKMRKHGDMTYEGDADWEILIDDQFIFIFVFSDIVVIAVKFFPLSIGNVYA